MKTKFYLSEARANNSLANQMRTAKKQEAALMVLFAMPLAIHTITAVLGMPGGLNGRVDRAKEIIDAAAVSTWVSVPVGTITDLNNKKTAYKNSTKSNRASTYRDLLTALKNLMATFQTAANLDPANAIAIIESGKFKVKQVHIPQIHEFGGDNGVASGSVKLTAPGGPTNASHLHIWRHSTDGINFTRFIVLSENRF